MGAAGSAARAWRRALVPPPAGADTGTLDAAPADGATCPSPFPAFCSIAAAGTLESAPAAASGAGAASGFPRGVSSGAGAVWPAAAVGSVSVRGAAAGGTDTRPRSVSGVTTASRRAAAAAHVQAGTRRGTPRRGSASTRALTRVAKVSK